MRILNTTFGKGAVAVAAGALLAAGCAGRDLPIAQVASAAPAVSVACEPSQRAIVRPVTVNGVTTSQVECVSSGVAPVAAPVTAPVYPAANGFQTVSYTPQPVAVDNGTVAYARPAVYQPVQAQPVTYAPAPRRVVSTRPVQVERRAPVRSVKKSAVIIGTSAGAGAGLGAAIGGKKGALIGAVVGGGGATLWDQITRHKQ